MKKTTFAAWLVLAAMLVPAVVHAEDANVENEPKLSFEASLSGDDANPVLTVWLTNIGEVPVIVDKELKFMFWIYPRYVENDGWAKSYEHLGLTDFPEVSELESRLLPLKSGEKIERQMRLQEGYEQVIAVKCPPRSETDTELQESFRVYTGRWKMREDVRPTKLEIVYRTNDFFVDYVAESVKNVDAAQLYRGKISLSVTVPYVFAEETVGDEPTE